MPDELTRAVKLHNKSGYENFWMCTGQQKKVNELEEEMLKLPQVSCNVTHKFGPGIYIREVFLPAGTYAIGHHQNFKHLNVFVKGRITIIGEDGISKEIKAPMTFTGNPGRKIGFIHEDSVWLNVYPTTETDIEKLEAHFIAKSDSWKADQLERQDKLKLLASSVDKTDYENVLKEFGFAEELARSQSENKVDMIDLPFGNYKIKTGKSNIEGTGLFATADIKEGELIAPARCDGKRTIAGRYTNHSLSPNAKMIQGPQDSIYLVAIKKITGCLGGQDGEEITINYRESLRLALGMGDKKCQQ